MKTVASLCSAVVFCFILFPDRVAADGEGCRTLRPLTAEETAYFNQANILRGLFPPAPAGWASDGQEQTAVDRSIPKQLCSDGPSYRLGLSVSYQKQHTAADDAAIGRVAQIKPDPAMQARVDQLMARQTALSQQLAAAAVKQDMATVEKLDAEMRPLVEQTQRLMDAMYAPQTQALAQIDRDRTASIRVEVNARGGTCIGSPETVNISGAVAWRCAHENSYASDSTSILDRARASMIIVLGNASVKIDPWTRRSREGVETPDRIVNLETLVDPARPLKVQNVVVEIESDNPERVASLYQGLKLDGLRTLLR